MGRQGVKGLREPYWRLSRRGKGEAGSIESMAEEEAVTIEVHAL
jgi:hypothetical protein